MAKRKTARQVAASRQNIKKAQLASARKRRGSSKRKALKRVAVGGAIIGGGIYAYHNRGTIKRNAYRAKPIASFVGGMVGNPIGAFVHLRALKGALQGKKNGLNFLMASYNWEKMTRENGGGPMYTIGR